MDPASRLRQSGLVPLLAWAVLSFLVLPAFVVFPVSVTDTRYLALPREGVSLQHWHNLATNPDWLGSIAQSLLIALASTAIALLAGALCAIGCWRLGGRVSEKMRLAMMLPMVVPTIVYALGLYRFYVDLELIGSPLGVVLAHAVTGLPYVVLAVTASLANFDPRLEQAARSLGASMPQTVRLVILPNILPGILSGGIFAFIHSWDELIIVIFIGGRRFFTLPRMIWNGINENLDPTIAAVAAGLILFTLFALLLELPLRARRATVAAR